MKKTHLAIATLFLITAAQCSRRIRRVMDRLALPTKPRPQDKGLVNVTEKRPGPRTGPGRSTSPAPAAARAAASGAGASRIAQERPLWGSGTAALTLTL
jgi:hypothetical protein